MLKHTKNLLRRNLLIVAAIAITLVVAVLSLAKINYQQPIKINHLDKIQHAIAYFVLTFIWLVAMGKSKKSVLIILISILLYGIVIEVLQMCCTTYRTAEYLDVFANSIGVLTAFSVFSIFKKKQFI